MTAPGTLRMPAALRRGSPAAPLSLRIVRCNETIAVRYRDWRRSIAALLGRFLPKLWAAVSRPFSWVLRCSGP
jgi:hypothetical protein